MCWCLHLFGTLFICDAVNVECLCKYMITINEYDKIIQNNNSSETKNKKAEITLMSHFG